MDDSTSVRKVVTNIDGKVSDSENNDRFYHIGTPGKPWSETERKEWKASTKIQRSYQDEVLSKLKRFNETTTLSHLFVLEQYGSLSHNPERYPLVAFKSRNWDTNNKHSFLVTGGVHGYETSGVQGALLFVETKAVEYSKYFNILVIPCVSPWAYEHIQRWQADLKDTNRSFQKKDEKMTEESRGLMEYLEKNFPDTKWICHLDLHETTDTDATEFMPAKHAEAGLAYTPETIPDGFYLVGDSTNPQLEFQKAVIESVKKVTHIAPPDDGGNIIGEPVVKNGIIVVPSKELGLCMGLTMLVGNDDTNKKNYYLSTTEVYPDSPKASDEICNRAQVAAIVGAMDYIISSSKNDVSLMSTT